VDKYLDNIVIDKLQDTEYNIIVYNALNGAMALATRKKFPKARIICAEVTKYFVPHLKKLGFEVVMFNEMPTGMRFDVEVGNPPYQDSDNKAKNNKLWHKFVQRSLSYTDQVITECNPVTGLTTKKTVTRPPLVKEGGIVALVTPSSIFNCDVGFGKKFKTDIMDGKSLLHAEIHRDKKHFDVGVETCHWIVKNGQDKNSIEFPSYRDDIIGRIVNKVNSHELKLNLVHENPHVVRENIGLGSTELFYSGKNKSTVDVPITNTGNLKLVFSFSAAYANQFVTTEPTAHLNRVLYINDIDHANQVMSYTTSKLFKFYANNYLKTSGFTPAVKNNQLPCLENKTWTDDELYQYFELTPEEIEYVESAVK
jgi:hypothetical protein